MSPTQSQTGITATVIFAIAIAIITLALAFEHLGGYRPCELCLQQRYAYYFAVPAAALAIVLAVRDTALRITAAHILIGLIAFAFLANMALGIYHAGAEWRFWAGPSTCGGADGVGTSAGGLLERMKTARVIRCDEAAWRFLGISFAGYNALISAFLATFGAFQLAQIRKNSIA